MPVGVVVWRGSTTVPSWGLLCDGQAVSRTTYAALFNVIGTTYGAGNGSTTFNVPTLTDSRYVFGAGTSVSRGSSGGSLNHTHLDAHGHGMTQPGAHDLHDVDGGHTHNAHTSTNLAGGSGTTTLNTPVGAHSAEGSHDHDAHSAHTGAAVISASFQTATAEPPHVDFVPFIIK